MTTNPFKGPRSKLERAHTHIHNFREHVSRFLARSPIELDRKLVAVRQEEHLVPRQILKIPDQLTLIAGDAIHNLRTALDHLACRLAALNGAKIVNDVYFPFAANSEIFPLVLKKKAKKLRPSDIEILTMLQPYPGGNDILYSLHKMDISDKHRELNVVGSIIDHFTGYISVRSPTKKSFQFSSRAWLRPQTNEPWVTFEVGSDVEYDFKISADVAFTEIKPIKNYPAVAALNQFSDLVESIIVAFETIHRSK